MSQTSATKDSIKFNSLYLSQNYQGRITGKMEFTSTHGTVSLNLSEDQGRRLVALVADMAVEDAIDVSEKLKREMGGFLLEQTKTPAIEAQPTGAEDVEGV